MKLKPCPFCGSEDLRISKLPKISNDLITFEMIPSCVSCMTCGADGPKAAYVDDVIEAWNQRYE
jgi:Lar family restriction alleviation protein